MSIEALLQAHIEAIKENTAAVLLLESTLVGRAGKPPKEEKSEPKSVKEEVKADQPSDKTAKAIKKPEEIRKEVEPDPADEGDHEPIGESTSSVPYETVRALVLKLAAADKREKIKAINAKHGIANLKVLLDKEDDFSTVNDQAKLEAVYAELQALEG